MYLKAIALGLVGVDTARALQPNLRGWVRAAPHESEASIQLAVIRSGDDDGVEGQGAPPTALSPKITFQEGERGSRLIAPSVRPLERTL